MNVDELRTLIRNLDELIHIPHGINRLRKTVLHLAITGKLVCQDATEGTASDLLLQLRSPQRETLKSTKRPRSIKTDSYGGIEAPFEIPNSWTWVRLGALGDFGSGATPARGNSAYYGGEINWYKSGELTDSVLDVDSVEKITEAALRDCSLRLNQSGDLLMAMYGATAGKLALLEQPGTTNQAVCGCTLHDGVVRHYVYYCLLSTRSTLIAKSSGAAQPNISKEKIVSHLVPLPPTMEQWRIAQKVEEALALIDMLDVAQREENAQRSKLANVAFRRLGDDSDRLALDHIHELTRTRADAKELDKAIISLAVFGKLVPQDPSELPGTEIAAALGADPIEIGLAAFPDTWAAVRLDQVAEVRLGRQRSPGRAFGERMRPYLRAANVTWNGLNLTDVKEMAFTEAESEGFELHDGDLLLSEASGSPSEVGKPAQYRGEIDACCFQNTLIRVRLRPPLHVDFYEWYLRHEALTGQFVAGSRGLGIQHLGAKTLAAWTVPVPPVEEQERIVTRLKEIRGLTRQLMKALAI